MRLSIRDFSCVVDKIAQEMVGRHLRKVVFYSSRIFYLQLSSGKQKYFIVNLDNANPSAFVSDLSNVPPTLINPFYLFLKKELTNAFVVSVRQYNEDRIIKIELEVLTSAYKKIVRNVYLEFISAHPNLIVTDNEDTIINAFRKNTIDSPRIIARGFKYNVPATMINHQVDETIFDYDKFIGFELSRLNQSSMTRNQEKFVKIFKLINSRIKAASKKIDNIKHDVERAEKMLLCKSTADAILASAGDKKEHRDEIVIDGKHITLDSLKSLAENAQSLYKTYKKAKNTIALSEKLLEEAEKELNEGLFVKDFLASSNEEEIERFVAQNAQIAPHERIRLPVTKKYAPYHLIDARGTTYYFGKTAEQNDYLSFVFAARQHTWLHIYNHPGAHVIIKHATPSDEDLVSAAEIALLCSNLDRGEVMYAKRKDISRGESKGEAHVRKFQTIYLSSIRPATKTLYEVATRLEVK